MTDEDHGARIHALIRRLYPICRSITGAGLRESLAILSEVHPIRLTEVPSGTPVLDWTVPQEWVIRDAVIADSRGRRIVDFRAHNLHVLNYSAPVRAKMRLAELDPHLHSLPQQPDLIPYRTSYYNKQWGFCLTQRQRDALDPAETYDVVIDSEFRDGAMTLGEIVLPGAREEEILVSTHTCHPSLCNDNLSGMALAVHLAAAIAARPRRLTYRFLFAPGTIGSIAWLALSERIVPQIRAGLVITGIGDKGELTYKRSRRGDAPIDRAARYALKARGVPFREIPFHPYGYDERQFCSPGFDLGVGRISRTPHGEYPEYHTSGDDPSFVTPAALADAFSAISGILEAAEAERVCRSLNPKGEPQLGRRGLYRDLAGEGLPNSELALLWVLAYADGRHSLLDVAGLSMLPLAELARAADQLERHRLVEPVMLAQPTCHPRTSGSR